MYYVYLIINKINNKKYVGYTSKHYTVRFSQHISASKRDDRKVLYKAIKKYGVENFEFRPISSASTIEMAKLFEQRTISTLDTYGKKGYNRTLGGDGSGPHTEDHKQYMRELMTNKIISDETRIKMSRSAKGKEKSEDFKKRVSEKLKNDPDIKDRNRIAGIFSHYKRGNKIKSENMKLIQHLIENDDDEIK
jgi:group I intron endonuclease